jgi:hypothetical protein
MKKNRCCPIDPKMKMVWEIGLQDDLDSLENAILMKLPVP